MRAGHLRPGRRRSAQHWSLEWSSAPANEITQSRRRCAWRAPPLGATVDGVDGGGGGDDALDPVSESRGRKRRSSFGSLQRFVSSVWFDAYLLRCS